jgi:hypothetical protein
MMRKISPRRHSFWNRYIVLRVALALVSLVSMVLASGAGGHWH